MNKLLIFVALAFGMTSTLSASAHGQISFGLDCMIHDQKGRLLSDLGMIGSMMGSYKGEGSFQYNDLKIEANLNGPFLEAPEVASPQLKITVTGPQGNILSSMVMTATPETNAALFIPTENVYLHCDKMDM